MKHLFDTLSKKCSQLTTNSYSTSFSFGIKALAKRFHSPIYGIYGFVRFADEIVDSFHGYDKALLLDELEADCTKAIERKISLNPILNSFQSVVHHYEIDASHIQTFLESMRMDLNPQQSYNQKKYNKYILGSAEVVGLMCLQVFTEGNQELYKKLKPYAQHLGAAFQKVNFLRDLKNDFSELGRSYFPTVDLTQFSKEDKKMIEDDIEQDFQIALKGIKMLPIGARGGVYLSYIYYYNLFKKIQSTPPAEVLNRRIRIHNGDKLTLMLQSVVKNQLNLI